MLVRKGEDLIRAKARENIVAATLENTNASKTTLVNLPKSFSGYSEEEPTPHKDVHVQTVPKVITPIHTRKEMATLAKVSEKTYEKGKVVLDKATSESFRRV